MTHRCERCDALLFIVRSMIEWLEKLHQEGLAIQARSMAEPYWDVPPGKKPN